MSSYAIALGPARLAPAAHEEALRMLSATERARYATMVEPVRDSFLAGRSVLRRLAAEQLGVLPAEVPLAAHCPDCGGSHGRPVIDGSRLELSLSHCADAVVAVAVWDRSIGVDIERRDASPQQEAAIKAVAAGQGIPHWTRVEATLKADGRGLRVDPRDVHLEGALAWVADRPTRYELFEPELSPALHVTVALALRA